MADKVSRFVLAFDGDEGDIASVLASLKSKVRQTATEIEQITRNLQLFKDTEANVKKAADAFFKASDAAANLRQEIARTLAAGKDVGTDLSGALRTTERAVASASKEYAKQAATLDKLTAQLTAAGVDTKNLAAEETRLAEAAKQANRALVEQASKSLLGFKSVADIKPKIAELNAAFIALRDSGKLSFAELGVAQTRFQQGVAALRAESAGLGAALSDIRGRVLGIAIALAGVSAGVVKAIGDFRDFRQQVAAVNSIVDVTERSVERLASGVREMAKAMGVDAVQSTRALYEIISSGIPEENSLFVLAEATKAAIAGLTDVDTAARIGVAVLNGYGLQVSKLSHVYDVLFQTVRDGIVTFPELAKNLGQVIPAARAANIPLEQLGSAMVVLTRQGIDAPEAATAINRAIIDMSAPAPEARDRMNELGIAFNGLLGTIEQLASRKLTLPQLQQIIPDVRATRAVLALANNFNLLRREVELMETAAGAAEKAYLKLADTPEQKIRKLNAAFKDFNISFGEFVFGGGKVVDTLRDMVNAFNALDPATKQTIFAITSITAGMTALLVVGRLLAGPLNLLVGALAATRTAALATAEGFTAARVAAIGFQTVLSGVIGFLFGKELRDKFEVFRNIGDVLGLVAAKASSLADFGLARLRAALTGNTAAANAATAAYRRNAQIIDEEYNAVISGSTERLRQLGAEQERLIARLRQVSLTAAEAAGATEAQISALAASIKTELTAAETFVAKFLANLQATAAKLGQAVEQVQAAASVDIGNINAKREQQLAQLALLQKKDLENLLATVEIQRKTAADRLAVLEQFAKDSVKAFEAEAKARLDIAKRTGENVVLVENQIQAGRAATLQKVVDAFRAHYKELVSQEQTHLDNIKSIQEQRIKINEDIESKIREIRRAGLTTYEQYADRVKEIDDLISKSRIAALQGDTKHAEEFANKAIGLLDKVSGEVKDGEKVIVSAFDAGEAATKRLKDAQEVLLFSLNKREQAEKKGAEAAKEAAESTKTQLDDLTKKLEAAQALAEKGIRVSISLNVDSVEKDLAALDEQIKKRDIALTLTADITQAQVAIQGLRRELEEGVTVNVKARIDQIEDALLHIKEIKPELDVGVDDALKSVDKVVKAAAEIDKIEHEIKVNADAARKEIDSLNNRNTTSTHTIKIVVDRSGVPQGVPVPDTTTTTSSGTGSGFATGGPVHGFARGGAVAPRWRAERWADGVPVHHFAGGGPVFRTPTWQKVPGSGNADTVPAALQAGSYVVRKAAVNYYGDDLMTHLASGGTVQNFALGGGVMNFLQPGPIAKNFLAGGAKAPTGDAAVAIGHGDPELHDIIIEAYRIISPLLDSARTLRKSSTAQNIDAYLARVLELIQNAPDARTARQLLDVIVNDLASLKGGIEQARRWNVPLVFGAFSGTGPSLAPTNIRAESTQPSFAYTKAADELIRGRFATGGAVGTDTVPAMLTPGEYVIRPQPVAHYGGRFMDAINRMQIPRAALAAMLAAAHPVPAVAHFAVGGPVGPRGVSFSQTSDAPAPAAALAGATININANAGDLFSRENVQRLLVPIMEEMLRKSGWKPSR